MVDILPIDKPAYKRSTKPLRRIPIADVVGPKDSKNYDNLTISDEDIDKLFNGSCQFEEIKGPIKPKEITTKPTANVCKEIKTKEVKPEEKQDKCEKSQEKESKIMPNNKTAEDSNKIATESSNKIEVVLQNCLLIFIFYL